MVETPQLLVDLGDVASVRAALGEARRRGREEALRIPRLPWDQFFMLHAHLAATRSTCDRGPRLLFDPGRSGTGAVLVRDRRIVAGGYNGSPPGKGHCSEAVCTACGRAWSVGSLPVDRKPCPACGEGEVVGGTHIMRDGHCVATIHAEANALLQCALDGVPCRGATLYVTTAPCFDCAKLLIRAGIVEVHFGEAYESRYGLSGEVLEYLTSAGVPCRRTVVELGGPPRG